MVGLGVSGRTTNWGNGLALAGATGIVVALIVAGPKMMDAAQRAYPEGRAARWVLPEQ